MTAELRLLLRLQLRAASLKARRSHETDKKKLSRLRWETAGQWILIGTLAAMLGAESFGLCRIGLGAAVPLSAALAVSAMAFFITFFKTNGTLFRFREYELLMSLPFSATAVAGARFVLLYVRFLPWALGLSLPMLLCAALMGTLSPAGLLLTVPLTLFLPLLPMTAASALGALVAALGSRFRHKQLVQTVLTLSLVLFCLSLRFILPQVFKNGETEEMLTLLASGAEKLTWYAPAVWFSRAAEGRLLPALAMSLASLAAAALFLWLLGKTYRAVNSRLGQTAPRRTAHTRTLRCRSLTGTVAYKELRRFLGSTTYLVNAGLGQVMTAVLCAALLFTDMDSVLAVITAGAPVTARMILPAAPFTVHFLLGMFATTACSPSLEGKQSWIPDSLPIPKKTLYRGKSLFNLWITVPFALLGNLCCGIACGAGAGELLLMLLCGTALCLFSTEWGLWWGVRRVRLDWENEIEVIKQGSAVGWYLLTNMLLTCISLVGAILLRGLWGVGPVLALFTAAALLLSLLLERGITKQAGNG